VLLAITSNATAIGRIVRLLAALRGQARAPAPAAAAPGQRRAGSARPRLVRT